MLVIEYFVFSFYKYSTKAPRDPSAFPDHASLPAQLPYTLKGLVTVPRMSSYTFTSFPIYLLGATMDRVLRFNNTDRRITYYPDWNAISNSGLGQNATYSLASTLGAQFFFLFRGTAHTLRPVYPLLLINLVVADTGIPSQVQASDYMAV